MIPKRVLLENFLSFGVPVEFRFDDGEPLWVLCGPNGVGKSSVFDAITYSLFGCHRGGKGQGVEKLIRHGANTFRVEFEFAFAGCDYRIQRNYGKKSVERVFRNNVEVDLPTGKNRVRDWAERELGVTYEQFTASVLLKQGEADKIITGTGKERLAMLKTIIGVDRFEALSDRVKDAAKAQKQKQLQLTEQVQNLAAVTDDERTTARERCEAAEAALKLSQAVEAVAATLVEQSRQFEKAERTRLELERMLDAANARQMRAQEILAQHSRWSTLDAAVPTLQKLIPARDGLAELKPQFEQLQQDEQRFSQLVAEAIAARDEARQHYEKQAEELRSLEAQHSQFDKQLSENRKLAVIAKEIEEVESQLAKFPADLDAQTKSAALESTTADSESREASERRTRADTLHRQRKKERQEFDKIEVGVNCSRCRQPVDAEHAERERRELDAVIARHQSEFHDARTAEDTANERLATAKTNHEQLKNRLAERDKWNSHKVAFTRHGPIPKDAEIEAAIHAAETKFAQTATAIREEQAKLDSQKSAGQTFEKSRAETEPKWKNAQTRLAQTRSDRLKYETQLESFTSTLRGEWATQWATLTASELQQLANERDSLKRTDIAGQHEQLQKDVALRAEWEQRLAATREEIEQLPIEARIPAAAANDSAIAAKQAMKQSAVEFQAAERHRTVLAERTERRSVLVEAERAAEKNANLHTKLDKLLGSEGLLRDLVRSAERQIVTFANETVRNLSDGDLAIELDDAEDGPDKAFTLKIRRADSEPIGVNYLSGSQKFRVAVAVALAIGRFATTGTQAKPLESVIIDEGFGSLDKDGLRCMAEELTRLKDKAGLKRIVLVSHQEEFVKSFPVGWQLERGENGTKAIAFRK